MLYKVKYGAVKFEGQEIDYFLVLKHAHLSSRLSGVGDAYFQTAGKLISGKYFTGYYRKSTLYDQLDNQIICGIDDPRAELKLKLKFNASAA